MEYQDKVDEVNKPERENASLKNEIEFIVRRHTKEIEVRKKNEENIVQSLKERADEWFGLTYVNDQLKLELTQSRNNGQELER